MTTQADSRWQQLRAVLGAFPVDIVVILSLVAALAVGLVTPSSSQLWTVPVGAVLLFFVPGYVLLAAIFPTRASTERATERAGTVGIRAERGIPFSDRVLLSFGTSVAMVPIMALVLALAGQPLVRSAILGLVSVVVAVLGTVAIGRRLRLPRQQRFRLPLGQWGESVRGFLVPGSVTAALVNVVLAVSVLGGVGAMGYAMTVPQPDAQFSSFALLTRTAGGEFVSSDYPTNFTQDEPQEVVFSVENNHRTAKEYTVVAELQRVRTNDQKRLQVLAEEEQRRFQRTLDPGETWRRPHDITPRETGQNLRLVYFLYRGDAPADPSTGTANQHLQLWINVSAASPPEQTPDGGTNGTSGGVPNGMTTDTTNGTTRTANTTEDSRTPSPNATATP